MIAISFDSFNIIIECLSKQKRRQKERHEEKEADSKQETIDFDSGKYQGNQNHTRLSQLNSAACVRTHTHARLDASNQFTYIVSTQ